MSLLGQIKTVLKDDPKANAETIAKAIGESIARVKSGLAEITGKTVKRKETPKE